jgi:DNA-binding CsgD family transcriptional regulator
VRKPQADLSAAVASAEKRYALTQAEARVLRALIEVGGGVAPSASALGLSRSTVKTHLARLFVKTGARGQVQLVKLIAGFGDTERQSEELGRK